MTVLAIETSCDETAVAILRDRQIVAHEIASQIAEHARFGGVVLEVASRNHLQQLPQLIDLALTKARIQTREIDAFAATAGPGLASSLLVGNSAAKGLAIGAGKPFLAINHLEGHLLSPFLAEDSRPGLPRQTAVPVGGESWPAGCAPAMTNGTPVFPHIALIVSGGHTLLVSVRGIGDYEILGRTLDDAVGEAFDKVAKMLGLGYPGGPEIEERAVKGEAGRFKLPRSMLDSGDLNFSFSGIKTAVRRLLPVIPSGVEGSREYTSKLTPRDPSTPLRGARDDGGADPDFAKGEVNEVTYVNDVCASFQEAVVDILREKSLRAVKQSGAALLTLSGGVSCNRALRENLRASCEKNGIEFIAAQPWLATDNAAMIAFAARLRLENGFYSSLAEEIDPNLALAVFG